MSTGTADFEALLREALSPVEPPADLMARMETALVNLTELAQEELEAWELSTMRDPRNWARPAEATGMSSAPLASLAVPCAFCSPTVASLPVSLPGTAAAWAT